MPESDYGECTRLVENYYINKLGTIMCLRCYFLLCLNMFFTFFEATKPSECYLPSLKWTKLKNVVTWVFHWPMLYIYLFCCWSSLLLSIAGYFFVKRFSFCILKNLTSVLQRHPYVEKSRSKCCWNAFSSYIQYCKLFSVCCK